MTSDEADLIELYKIARERETHENDLINHRTSWLVTIQSVLLATFGFSFQKYYEVAEKIYEKQSITLTTLMDDIAYRYRLFLICLCLIGIVSSLSGFISINSAVHAQTSVRKTWKAIIARHKESYIALPLPSIAGGGDNDDAMMYYGSLFSKALAVICAMLWCLVILVVLLSFVIKWGMPLS